MVAVTKLDQKNCKQLLPQWITTYYCYRLQCFMACSAECLMVMLNAFHDLFLAASGTSFLQLNLCALLSLRLEARHTMQNVEVPSHTSINHLCPIVFLCLSDDAKVKWICSNNTSNFYIYTFYNLSAKDSLHLLQMLNAFYVDEYG